MAADRGGHKLVSGCGSRNSTAGRGFLDIRAPLLRRVKPPEHSARRRLLQNREGAARRAGRPRPRAADRVLFRARVPRRHVRFPDVAATTAGVEEPASHGLWNNEQLSARAQHGEPERRWSPATRMSVVHLVRLRRTGDRFDNRAFAPELLARGGVPDRDTIVSSDYGESGGTSGEGCL